jgi:hypothetical protein
MKMRIRKRSRSKMKSKSRERMGKVLVVGEWRGRVGVG